MQLSPARFGSAFALALVAIFSCAPSLGAEKRLMFLTNGSAEFWTAARRGVEDANQELKLAEAGFKGVFEENNGTPTGQLDKLRQFATQDDIAGVAVSVLDADNVAVAEQLRLLRKKGVQVICVDADVNRARLRDARSYYLGTDNVAAGKELGKAMHVILQSHKIDKGSYVQFVGRTGSMNARERMNGVQATIGAEYTQADRMADDMVRIKAQENVRNAVNNHPEMVALIGIWSYNAPAIVDVLREKKLGGKYRVGVIDAEPLTIKYMGEGAVDVAVVQNPYRMGHEAMRLLKAMVTKDEATIKEMFPGTGPDADIYDTGLKVVVPNAESPLKREMFEQNTQFLTLEELKAWMAQHSLKGT